MAFPLSVAVGRLLDVAFPPNCPACGRGLVGRAGEAGAFCRDCEDDLPLFEGVVCRCCATPLAASAPTEAPDCAVCRGERWAFDAVVALGAYDGLLRRLVLDTKRRSGEAEAVALGRLLATRQAAWLGDLGDAVVVPTPQHWRRRFSRRADGVASLASGLAAARGLTVRRALRRSRPTVRQTEIAPSERARNVRGAFRVVAPRAVEGRTVLLIDDVLTTGSTCHAAAKALRDAGAGRVVAVVAARRVGPL